MSTVNERVRDAILEQELLNRRVVAGTQAQIDRRLAQLQRDLGELTRAIDPLTPERSNAREARLAKLEKRSKQLMREAYTEIAMLQRQTARRIARVESKRVGEVVREEVP